jgi:hypothetical protein
VAGVAVAVEGDLPDRLRRLAVVVVVSPSRLLACSLKLSRLSFPTLLSLPQAADITSATPASRRTMALRLMRSSPND